MIPFVSTFIKNGWISPAMGRFIEIFTYSVLTYVLTALSVGDSLSLKGLVAALATAGLSYISKNRRDVRK